MRTIGYRDSLILTVYAPGSRYATSVQDVLQQGGIPCSQEALFSTTAIGATEDSTQAVACEFSGTDASTKGPDEGQAINTTAAPKSSMMPDSAIMPISSAAPLALVGYPCNCTNSFAACCPRLLSVMNETQPLIFGASKPATLQCCNATTGQI